MRPTIPTLLAIVASLPLAGALTAEDTAPASTISPVDALVIGLDDAFAKAAADLAAAPLDPPAPPDIDPAIAVILGLGMPLSIDVDATAPAVAPPPINGFFDDDVDYDLTNVG
jgi:hypothetical protein